MLSHAQIQMHYGVEDISFVQLQRFHTQMVKLGFDCPQYECFIYPNRDHDLIGDRPVEERVNRFAKRVIENEGY